jgi:restriction endonuclease Mrr
LFTQEAREYAEEQNVMIDLIDGEELYKMIRKSDQDYYD